MKITIIGASAGVGLETTRLAIEKGHEVTGLLSQYSCLTLVGTHQFQNLFERLGGIIETGQRVVKETTH